MRIILKNIIVIGIYMVKLVWWINHRL